MLVLFSMGITKGKWSTLLTELLEFKRHYDANIPLIEALPSVARSGATYAGMGLRDLCDALHACYCENATARAMRRMYTALPEPPWARPMMRWFAARSRQFRSMSWKGA